MRILLGLALAGLTLGVAHAEKLSYISDHWAQVAPPAARVQQATADDHPTRRLP